MTFKYQIYTLYTLLSHLQNMQNMEPQQRQACTVNYRTAKGVFHVSSVHTLEYYLNKWY